MIDLVTVEDMKELIQQLQMPTIKVTETNGDYSIVVPCDAADFMCGKPTHNVRGLPYCYIDWGGVEAEDTPDEDQVPDENLLSDDQVPPYPRGEDGWVSCKDIRIWNNIKKKSRKQRKEERAKREHLAFIAFINEHNDAHTVLKANPKLRERILKEYDFSSDVPFWSQMGNIYLCDIVKTIQPKNCNMNHCMCQDTTKVNIYKYCLLNSIMNIDFVFNSCFMNLVDYVIEHFGDMFSDNNTGFCYYCRKFKDFDKRFHYIIDVCIQNKGHENFPKNLMSEYFDTFFYFQCDFNEYMKHWNKNLNVETNGISEYSKCYAHMVKFETENYLSRLTPEDIGEEMTPEEFKEYIVVANQEQKETEKRIVEEHIANGTEPKPVTIDEFFESMQANKSTRCDFCDRLYPLYSYESVQGDFFTGTVCVYKKHDDPDVEVAAVNFGYGSRFDESHYHFSNVDDARKGLYICDICASEMIIDGRLVN